MDKEREKEDRKKEKRKERKRERWGWRKKKPFACGEMRRTTWAALAPSESCPPCWVLIVGQPQSFYFHW